MRTLSALLSLPICGLTVLTVLGAGCGTDAPTSVPTGHTGGNATGGDGKDDESSDPSATDKGDDVVSPPSNTKPTPDASKPKPTPDAGTPSTDAGQGTVDTGAVVAKADDASTDAAATAPVSGSHFPRAMETVDIKAKGPYTVKTYTDGLSEPTYASSMMYYPAEAEPPFAVVAFTPGFTATKENYTFLGDMLASHGIAALLTTPTSTSDQPPARGKDLVAAVARIKAENDREGSPLKGKIAVDRICVTGHSMGGGGTLYAANELGDKIKCAVPMQPWQPGGSFPKVTAPILFIGAQSDTIAAVAQNALPHYMSIPDTTEKIYAEFAGKDHYLSTNRTSEDDKSATPSFDPQAAYIIPFYKLFLEDDTRYRDYLYGDKQVKEPLSKYMHSKM